MDGTAIFLLAGCRTVTYQAKHWYERRVAMARQQQAAGGVKGI
jgi:hypothetical protein